MPEATFSVADLGEPLPLEDASFDAALASLVLHYLRDWVPTLRELRRVLRPDGALVLSTHHPPMALELSESGDYFATELVVDRWSLAERDYDVRFWRRPLGEGLPRDRGRRLRARAVRAAAAARMQGAPPGGLGAPRAAAGVPAPARRGRGRVMRSTRNPAATSPSTTGAIHTIQRSPSSVLAAACR